MFVRVKSTSKDYKKKIQICENTRQGAVVKQVIIRHVGVAHSEDELIDLKRLANVLVSQIKEERYGPFLFDTEPLKDKPLQNASQEDHQKLSPTQSELDVSDGRASTEPLEANVKEQESMIVDLNQLSEQQRVVEGFHDVFGHLFNIIGLNKVLPKKQTEVLKEVVLARIAKPASKRATQEILAADFGVDIHLDRIYRMMDSLIENKDIFQKVIFSATQALCFDRVNITFFDVTTLYFESTEEDDLRKFGYSKDQKFQSVQVVLALATTQDGLPIGYKAFPGNTGEVSTLLDCLTEWKKQLPIGEVVVVADRAMMCEKNLAALEEANIKYVIAAKLKKLPKEVQERILKKEGDRVCIGEEVHSLQDFKVTDGRRRLVVTHSDARARKDQHDRERLLEKIVRKIGKGKNVKKLAGNRGYQKYLKVEGDGTVLLDEKKLAEDERWDGLHGVITSDLEEGALDLLQRYRRLWVIEESFRIQKSDLAVRPIYHFLPERVQAHLLISYLAFALIRHAEYHTELQGEKISVQEMQRHLWRTQFSVLKDHVSNALYRVPSKPDEVTRRIYRAFGLTRNERICKVA